MKKLHLTEEKHWKSFSMKAEDSRSPIALPDCPKNGAKTSESSLALA